MTCSAKAVFVALLLLLAACGDLPGFGPMGGALGSRRGTSGKKLRVACGQDQLAIEPIFESFAKRYGVTLSLRFLEDQEIAHRILDDELEADVVLLARATFLEQLARERRLAVLPRKVLLRVPPAMRHRAGRFVGLSGRARTFTYDGRRVSPYELPQTLDDLTVPRWASRVVFVSKGPDFLHFVAGLIKEIGEEQTLVWLSSMVSNGTRSASSGEVAIRMVMRGAVDGALAVHTDLQRFEGAIASGLPLQNHYFANRSAASMVHRSAVAITRRASNKELATDFLMFLLSRDVQRDLSEELWEIPFAPGVEEPEGMPRLIDLEPPNLDGIGETELAQANQILKRAM